MFDLKNTAEDYAMMAIIAAVAIAFILTMV